MLGFEQNSDMSSKTKRHYAARLLVGLLVLVVGLLLALYALVGTQGGSKFILDRVAKEAGASWRYDGGNLRDGVWLSRIAIAGSDTLDIEIDKAYVKMGWRALFARQVHVREANIGNVRVIDKELPTDTPFDYPTLEMPLALKLQDTKIAHLSYEQATVDPVIMSKIAIGQGTWQGSQIELTDGAIKIDEVVSLTKIDGQIDLRADYPLSVRVDVQIASLDEHYVKDVSVQTAGTLRRTVGTVLGRYNDAPVEGDFVVQGMDDGTPFSATLRFDALKVPYAVSENIELTDGVLTAAGVWSAFELRLNTDLTANTAPNGHYHGRATVTPEGMTVHHLQAKTVHDDVLIAKGVMDWQKDFWLTSTIRGDGVPFEHYVPDEYREYGRYLPQTLTGELGFGFWTNDDKHTRYQIDLTQQDGEQLNLSVKTPNNSKKDVPPYQILARWQNLVRTIDSLGVVDSPRGQADVLIDNGMVDVSASAHVLALSSLPSGDYTADAYFKDNHVNVRRALYQGELGTLNATAKIDLATDDRPLSYNVSATTDHLVPNAYFKEPNKTPIAKVSGRATLVGTLAKDGNYDKHNLSLSDSDLRFVLDNNRTPAQHLHLTGGGQAQVLVGERVEGLQVSFEGRLGSAGIAHGLADNAVSVSASGSLDNLVIDKLTLSGEAGHVSAAGTLALNDGVAWQMAVRGDELDTSKFYANSPLKLTGDLVTSGSYQDGTLGQTQVAFVGDVLAGRRLPTGKLTLKMMGDGRAFVVQKLGYHGQAGELSAQGSLNLAKGVSADVSALMRNFDVGQFVKDYRSQLSGELSALVGWQQDRQTFQIRQLDLAGVLNDEPVLATGQLSASLRLPSDIKGYFATLKKPTFDLDKLLEGRLSRPNTLYGNLATLGQQAGDLQANLINQDKEFRKLVERLVANNVIVQIGDNRFGIDGNEERLSMSIDAKDLTQVAKTIRGQITGGVVLVGDDNRLPTIYSDLTLSNISMPSFALRQGSVLGQLIDFGNSDSAVVVQGVGVVAFGRSFKQARLDVRGTQAHHAIVGFVNDGNLQVQSRLQGGFDGERYAGVLSEGRLRTYYGAFNQSQPAELRYHGRTGQLTLAAHCWQTLLANNDKSRGSLCLQDTLMLGKGVGQVNALIHNLDTSVFDPLLPSDLSIKATLNGKVKATWDNANAKRPYIQVALYSDNGELGLRSEGLPDTTMGYERISVIAQSVQAGLKLRTDIRAGQAGNGFVDVILDPYKDDKPIAGSMTLNALNLAMVRPFFPAMRVLEGEINMAGGIGGTLRRPLFYGNANLADGRIALAEVPLSFNDLNVLAQVQGTSATLAGEFVSGGGQGKLAGELDWQGDVQAKFSIQGDKLAVSQPPLLSAQISPHLEIVARPKQKYVDIKGVVSIPSATLRPPESSDEVIGLSPDVTVIDRRATGNIDDILQKVTPWSINADVGLDLGDDVVFRGFGARLPLAGAVHVTQNGQGVAQGRGMVQVSERTAVEFLGQKLDLNYAQIRFNGNLKNPRLSIEGVREIDGQTVGVRVTGSVASPDIQVFNDAGLSEQQAMNALATGSLSEFGATQISEQGFRSQVTNSLAVAGLSLGLKSTHGVTNEIGRALGLESLVVDASGSADDANVNVTGYISPDLYIRYGVGVFNAQSSLSMRYQLTRRVYIEATSATERIVDVVYRWRFK